MCACRASCQNRKCPTWALEGLGPTFGHKLKLWSDIGAFTSLNVQWEVRCLREHSPPQCFGFNEIHRPLWWPQTDIWYSGHQDNMHTNSVWCRSSPSLGWMHCLMCTAGEGIQGLRGMTQRSYGLGRLMVCVLPQNVQCDFCVSHA